MYTPAEIAKIASDVSIYKVNRKFYKILISAILAGLFIGLGYYANIVIRASLGDDKGLNIFLGGFIFAVGIAMVIIAGADLFTGSCLIMFGVYDKKVQFSKVVVHLLIVLLGNFIGGIFLAFLIYFSKMPTGEVKQYVLNVFNQKTSLGFIEAVLRGILCNILVAIGVYMAYAAKNVSGKIIAAVLPVAAFVVMGFEHSVANMFILPLGFMFNETAQHVGAEFNTILSMFTNNLIPVIIGNFIGGGIILPLAYYFIFLKNDTKNTSV